MKINLDVSKGRRYLGSGKCYGCGKQVTWNELAEKVGLRTIDGELRLPKNVPKVDVAKVKQNLIPNREDDAEDKRLQLFPLDRDWRGFSRNNLLKVGAKIAYMDLTGRYYLYLPVNVEDKLVGYIRAQLKRDPDSDAPAYINKSGVWTKTHGLFPFDYAIDLMRRKGLRTMVLVEGPRDALRLLFKGIPAVAIMGTQNWTSRKRLLLESAGVERLVFLLDGDRAGKEATYAIWPEVRKFMECKVIPLWKWAERRGLKKMDPYEAPKELRDKVRTLLI
jgi:5S rRNA maturation endonuclease (ribonuclease M5)